MPNAPQAEQSVAGEAKSQPVKANQEYWRPILPSRADSRRQPPEPAKQCQACGTDFVADACFCHACGAVRSIGSGKREEGFQVAHEIARATLKTLASALFAVGLVFALIAAILGWIYSPTGYEGWQAIQSWRTEWLLAAAVSLLASLCLRSEIISRP